MTAPIRQRLPNRREPEPELVEPGSGSCPKCGLLVRWREYPNGRGDPSVGIVDHDYAVRGPRRTR